MAAVAEKDEQKELQLELLALIHENLLQAGYTRTAQMLLEQSGQKTFPSYPVPLWEIFDEWKKLQTTEQKADDDKREIPAMINKPMIKSSLESSEEEEVMNTPKKKKKSKKLEFLSEDASQEKNKGPAEFPYVGTSPSPKIKKIQP